MRPRLVQLSLALFGVSIAAVPATRAAPSSAVTPLKPGQLETLWSDLAAPQARRAYAALCRLADRPAEAVPFLRKHLRPAGAPDARRVARLIADLDHDDYTAREKASRALERLGDLAAPALRKALAGGPPPEVRRRAEALLAKLDRPVTDPEVLRHIRAVEALERMGTAEAWRLLEELAKGAPAARLTREAQASLQRRKTRPVR